MNPATPEPGTRPLPPHRRPSPRPRSAPVPGAHAEPGPPLARTARLGAANLAGAALAGVAGLGVTFLVARALGPAPAGSFFAATSAFVLFGGFARLGTSTGLVYWPARLRARATPELIRPYLRAALIPVTALSIVIAAGVIALAPVLAPGYATPLRVLALFLPAAALSDAVLAATRGLKRLRPTIMLDKLLKPGAQLGCLAALAVLAGGAGHLELWALAWVAPSIPVLILGAVQLSRALPPPLSGRMPRPRRPQSPSAAFWRFTAPRAVASAAQTALQRIDVLLVAALAGLAPAAMYAVAGRFVVLGQLANGSISQAVQPKLAEALAVGDVPTARTVYRTATGWLVLTTWPLHLLVFRFAAEYLALFGPAYAAAVPVVRLLAATMLVSTGCGMVDMVLTMAGKTSWNLTNVLAALVVTTVLDLLLIPHLGILGAAIGLACAVLVNNLAPLAQISFSLGLHPFGRNTAVAASLALGCFGALPLLVPSPVLAIPLAVAVYAIGLYRLRAVLHLPSLIPRSYRVVKERRHAR